MFGLAPGIDGAEVIVILVVALIVVGPKDLPGLVRRVGKFLGRMRAMATDFRASFDEMARQSELDDLRREIAEMKGLGPYAKQGLTEPASQIGADIEAELKKPAAAARPFAAAEPSEESGLEVEPASIKPTLARANRPFAVAEPVEVSAAAEAAPAEITPPALPPAEPAPLASSRPFAPAADPAALEMERRQA